MYPFTWQNEYPLWKYLKGVGNVKNTYLITSSLIKSPRKSVLSSSASSIENAYIAQAAAMRLTFVLAAIVSDIHWQ